MRNPDFEPEDDFRGWAPFGIRREPEGTVVDWCYLGSQPLREPFFDQSVRRVRGDLESCKNRVTSLQTLERILTLSPGLSPAGFIYHMSRCGSTLIAQMLAANGENLVLSEPAIVQAVLGGARDATGNGEDHVSLLRHIVGALGRRRAGGEKHYFIKLASASIRQLPLIRRAFPETPWIFVYRDPVEVLAAILRQAREMLPPGLAAMGLVDGDPASLEQLPPAEFWARVLAGRCSDALRFQSSGKSLLVNYRQLPALVWESLPDFFGVSYSAEDIERMKSAARFDAKNPSRLFAADSAARQQAATDRIHELAEQWIMPHYRRLEELRMSGG